MNEYFYSLETILSIEAVALLQEYHTQPRGAHLCHLMYALEDENNQ